MKIATWNVNGIRARKDQCLEWIEAEKPDVICLQEIKASPEKVPEALCEMSGYACYWHGAGGYSGVGLHIRQELHPEPPSYHHPDFDLENRIVAADVGSMTIASVYVPNGGKDFAAKLQFLDALDRWVETVLGRGRDLIVCGDINIARTDRDVHPKELKPNVIGQLPEEREILERILSRGLVDVGRALDPDNDGLFTWWAPWRNMRQRNIGWRIDYILANERLYAKARSSTVQREVGTSDHAPLLAEFDV